MRRLTKYCKNIECEEPITEYKSSKRLYCSEYCRNRDGYLRRLEENKEFIENDKVQRQNYVLLNRYAAAGIYSEDLSKLMKFGFNPKHLQVGKLYTIEGRKCYIFTLKDIKFELDEINKLIIIHNSKHHKNGRN
jgi:hypothetical protein